MKIRIRRCDSPPPSGGGVGCTGSNRTAIACNIKACSGTRVEVRLYSLFLRFLITSKRNIYVNTVLLMLGSTVVRFFVMIFLYKLISKLTDNGGDGTIMVRVVALVGQV